MKRINITHLSSFTRGFTLIELLIVIVIIGILAGVIIAVINPAQLQTKSKQAVMRATTEKACLALNACGSTSDVVGGCDTAAESGLVLTTMNGTPLGSTYSYTAAGNVVTIVGTLSTCTYTCAYDFTAGAVLPANTITAAVACLVQ